MPLTDAEVRNAKPSNKVQYLFDTGGIYLQINPKANYNQSRNNQKKVLDEICLVLVEVERSTRIVAE